MSDYNILIGHLDDDLIAFCFDGEPVRGMPWETRWPQIMRAVGAFGGSASQARKAGWDVEVAPGWSYVRVGRREIFVLRAASQAHDIDDTGS